MEFPFRLGEAKALWYQWSLSITRTNWWGRFW